MCACWAVGFVCCSMEMRGCVGAVSLGFGGKGICWI